MRALPLALSDISPSDISRFWSFVHKTEQCWIWLGGTSGGYGCFSLGGKTVRAHRLSSVIATGEDWPPDLISRHTCNNELCVRPDHVLRGTQYQNVADSIDSGARLGKSLTDVTKELVIELGEKGCSWQNIANETGISKRQVGRVLHEAGICSSRKNQYS